MNNVEKEQNEAFRPMYNYAYYRQRAHQHAQDALARALKTFGGMADTTIVDLVESNVYEHIVSNSPPAITTLRPASKGGPKLLSPSKPLAETLEIADVLVRNVCAFPHLLSEIVNITEMTLNGVELMTSTAPEYVKLKKLMKKDGANTLCEWLMNDDYYEHLNELLTQFTHELPLAIVNTRWALKQLMTRFFLKHSHKIQLSEVVQKMFELTDISPDVEISKDLKLPYPMNYIEFNNAIPFENDGIEFDITGALLYEVMTAPRSDVIPPEDDNLENVGNDGTRYAWKIENFPKANLCMGGYIQGLIGVDQAYQSVKMAEDGKTNYILTSDKGYFPESISSMDFDSEGRPETRRPLGQSLMDVKHTANMGIPLEDTHYNEGNICFSGFLSCGFKQLLNTGYNKLSHRQLIGQTAMTGKIIANHMVVDPYITTHNPPGEMNGDYESHKPGEPYISTEKYTVIELVINHKEYDPNTTALFSNIGPYLEIGRRLNGDVWRHVQEAFNQTMNRSYSENIDSSPFLEAFKIALQSIWFINEPDVKLKEAAEVQPTKGRNYFPKRKVTNKRKIVLRGEINRYLNSLTQALRRSPNHAFWVRGHWRRQWYPSIQGHKRKWIRPYVKGMGKATKQQVDLEPNTGD